MSKRFTKRGGVRKGCRKERRKGRAQQASEVQLVLDREELVAMMQDSLTSFATEMGLKVATLLRRTLATTNPIESAFSVAQNVSRRVKRWREGNIRQRWCVAGLMRAESKFRRVKGYRHLPQLLTALDRLVPGKSLDENRKTA